MAILLDSLTPFRGGETVPSDMRGITTVLSVLEEQLGPAKAARRGEAIADIIAATVSVSPTFITRFDEAVQRLSSHGATFGGPEKHVLDWSFLQMLKLAEIDCRAPRRSRRRSARRGLLSSSRRRGSRSGRSTRSSVPHRHKRQEEGRRQVA